MTPAPSCVVDGRTWSTFTCSFESVDGKFTFTIMAVSIEHAAVLLDELKRTATLDGQLIGTLPA